MLSDILLILRKVCDTLHLFRIKRRVHKASRNALRQKLKENLLKLPGIYRPPVCRKTDLKTQHDIALCRVHLARRAL